MKHILHFYHKLDHMGIHIYVCQDYRCQYQDNNSIYQFVDQLCLHYMFGIHFLYMNIPKDIESYLYNTQVADM